MPDARSIEPPLSEARGSLLDELTALLSNGVPALEEQRSVRVAVIDSGWTRALKDARIQPGIAIENDGAVDDDDQHGHGTWCTSIILALAPTVEIVPVRVFGSAIETSPSTLIEALRRAASLDLDIVNLSASTVRGDAIQALYAASAHVRSCNTWLVAAAYRTAQLGGYPATFEPVIGVGVGSPRQRSPFSYVDDNAIECFVRPDLLDVPHIGGSRRGIVMHTSLATAVVTGVLARRIAANPKRSCYDARDDLRRLAASWSQLSTFTG